MNFLQLVRRVKLESGRGTSGPDSIALATGNDLRLLNWTAQAWIDIQNLPRNWRWMRKTALASLTGATSYTPASLGISDWGRWVRSSTYYAPSVFDPSNLGTEWRLRELEYEDFRQRFLTSVVATGEPVYWSQSPEGYLLVGPDLAARTLRIDYWQTPVTLALDADIPAMPQQHHMAIVWAAAMQVAGFDAAPELMTRCSANYEAALSALSVDQGERIQFMSNPMSMA